VSSLEHVIKEPGGSTAVCPSCTGGVTYENEARHVYEITFG